MKLDMHPRSILGPVRFPERGEWAAMEVSARIRINPFVPMDELSRSKRPALRATAIWSRSRLRSLLRKRDAMAHREAAINWLRGKKKEEENAKFRGEINSRN
jgi:hypothetical protein